MRIKIMLTKVNPQALGSFEKIQQAYKSVIDALAELNGSLHPMLAKSSLFVNANYEALGASDKLKVAKALLTTMQMDVPKPRDSYTHAECGVCRCSTKHVGAGWNEDGQMIVKVCLECRTET